MRKDSVRRCRIRPDEGSQILENFTQQPKRECFSTSKLTEWSVCKTCKQHFNDEKHLLLSPSNPTHMTLKSSPFYSNGLRVTKDGPFLIISSQLALGIQFVCGLRKAAHSPPGLSQLAGNWGLNWKETFLIVPKLKQSYTKSIQCKTEARKWIQTAERKGCCTNHIKK